MLDRSITVRFGSAFIGMMMIGASSGSALALPTVYDLATQWSDVSNPNGVWTYEVNNAIASSNIRSGDPFGTPTPIWGFGFTGWSKSNGTELFYHDWSSGDVYGHSPNHGGGGMAIAWTSPVDGIVDISGGIWEGRDIGRSNDWSLTKNGVELTSGIIASGDPFDSSNPFDFTTGSGGSSAVTALSVSTGDILRLHVEVRPTSTYGDYVVVNLTFTQSETNPAPDTISEPATLTLFGLGLAGLGYMRRKRAAQQEP